VNPTSRAILQSVVTTDSSLTIGERDLVQRLISGQVEEAERGADSDARALVTQKRAAELLSVNRVTIWRMTKEGLLHPVEILPGTWRYPLGEIMRLTQRGISCLVGSPRERRDSGVPSAA
jgi:predicted methyltransferase MtxX (methanogen marker protein 4)